jgi:hypothetical protein
LVARKLLVETGGGAFHPPGCGNLGAVKEESKLSVRRDESGRKLA